MSNIVRARVTIRGTRPMVQHQFGPDAIPLEKQERTGVAGNDPEEWKKTCMVAEDGRLYVPGTYVFSCLKNGAVHTKKGRGSIQGNVVATLEVEEELVYLNRRMPEGEPLRVMVMTPQDPETLVYVFVTSVRNPATKGRNVRYRLTTRAGWKATFTLKWDKTLVPREQMRAVLKDAGTFGGIGDAIKIGAGRFEVAKYEELIDAEEKAATGSVDDYEGNGVEPRRKKMRSV